MSVETRSGKWWLPSLFFYTSFQFVSDAACALAGFLVVQALSGYVGLLEPWIIGVVFTPLPLLIYAGWRLYTWPALTFDVFRAERLIRGSLWALLGTVGILLIANLRAFPRRELLIGWILSTALILFKRWSIGLALETLGVRDRKRILLIGPEELRQKVADHFRRLPFWDVELLSYRTFLNGDGLSREGRTGGKDAEIWITASDAITSPLPALLGRNPATIRYVWDLWPMGLYHQQIVAVHGFPLLVRLERGAIGLRRLAKRLFDVVFALLVCLLTLPILLLVAVAIKLSSEGPVFFVQRRVGKDGKEFLMFKFRTMHATTEQYADKPATEGDPRITRFGRLLRKTGIDELPQLLNVLRGEMSFVGPRPEMPFKVADYTPLERERLKAIPGITGLWQINVHRSREIHKTLEYDLYYIEHQSFLLDLVIIGATLPEVFKGFFGRSIIDV